MVTSMPCSLRCSFSLSTCATPPTLVCLPHFSLPQREFFPGTPSLRAETRTPDKAGDGTTPPSGGHSCPPCQEVGPCWLSADAPRGCSVPHPLFAPSCCSPSPCHCHGWLRPPRLPKPMSGSSKTIPLRCSIPAPIVCRGRSRCPRVRTASSSHLMDARCM